MSHLHFVLVLFAFTFKIIFCQVCIETKLVWREVPETYSYTYLEAYEKPHCLFWCTDTRVATAVSTRNVQKNVPEEINVCCDGYAKDEQNNNNSIHCKPICSAECKNGYCKAPGECGCNAGYIPDIDDPYNCAPLCHNSCGNGICVAPNTCQCDPGYDNIGDKCEPVCTEPCENGVCAAPDTCHCLPGYQRTETNTCELHCSSYTEYGECIYSFTCEPGWIQVATGGIDICEPICSNPCVNGYCVAPETCECFHGYTNSTDDKCDPFCSSGCPHGECVGPEVCVCNSGWYKKGTEDVCLAHCDRVCGNGTCIAPDVCECFLGYKLREDEDFGTLDTIRPLCVPVCKNCEGSCIAPGQCICEPPFESRHIASDGSPCDCFHNCSDWANQCVSTVCVNTSDIDNVTNDITTEYSDARADTALVGVAEKDEDYSSTELDYDNHYEKKIKTTSWFRPKWIYGSIVVVLTGFIILIIVAVIKRNSISKNILFYRDATNKEELPKTVHYKHNCVS